MPFRPCTIHSISRRPKIIHPLHLPHLLPPRFQEYPLAPLPKMSPCRLFIPCSSINSKTPASVLEPPILHLQPRDVIVLIQAAPQQPSIYLRHPHSLHRAGRQIANSRLLTLRQEMPWLSVPCCHQAIAANNKSMIRTGRQGPARRGTETDINDPPRCRTE